MGKIVWVALPFVVSLEALAGGRVWNNFPEKNPDVKQIRSTAFAVGFDVARKGEIAWMKSCPKGVDFSAGVVRGPLFRLSFVPADPAKSGVRRVTPANARSFTCDEWDRKIRLVYGDFDSEAVDCVECTASCEQGDNRIYWGIAVRSKDGWKCVHCDYPLLPAANGVRDGSFYFSEPLSEGGLFATTCWDLAPGEKADDDLIRKIRASKNTDGFDAGEGAPRVLFLGNSITGTGPANRWDGCWGMTASWPEKDYVHLVVSGLEKRWGKPVSWRRRNLAPWERNLATWSIEENLKAERAFKPELVIVALGENVPNVKTEGDGALFKEKLTELVRMFSVRGAKVVVRSPFWERFRMDEICAAVAGETGSAFVDLKGAGQGAAYQAVGSSEDSGVCWHPGDAGMRYIAERILKAIE